MPVDFSGNGYLATDAAVVVDAFETALEKLAVDRRKPEALVVLHDFRSTAARTFSHNQACPLPAVQRP